MGNMNMKAIIAGVITIVVFLIVFSVVVTQSDSLWTAIQLTTHTYTGLTQFVALIPLLVLLGGMGFGGWEVYQGVKGKGPDNVNMKGMMAGIVTIFVFLVIYQIVLTVTDDAYTTAQTTTHTFTGLTQFLGLVPLLVLLGGMGLGGLIFFRSSQGNSALPHRTRRYARAK